MASSDILTAAHVNSAMPVLPVKNLAETIDFWIRRLGFRLYWHWTEGGELVWMNRDAVNVQLVSADDTAIFAPGTAIFNVRNVRALYVEHSTGDLEIVTALHVMPWGGLEYVVKELNGHTLCFRGAEAPDKKSTGLPRSLLFHAGSIGADEYNRLRQAVAWVSVSEDVANRIVTSACYTGIAQDTVSDTVVGCLIMASCGSDYFISDIIVHPEWQGQRIGSKLVTEAMNWLSIHGVKGSVVHLNTDENLSPFYGAMGFSRGFAMYKTI